MFSLFPEITRLCKILSTSWSLCRLFTRPIRRLLFCVILVLCVTFFVRSSVYSYIVDLYIPDLSNFAIKRDMSKEPVIKDQERFIQTIIEPTVTKKRVFLLVLISSGASGDNHVSKRMAIRKTWGKPIEGKRQWRIAFILGRTNQPLVDSRRVNEAKKYGDMIIGNSPDTYRNITRKLMMAFKWASKQEYEYLLKTDDDVYINIPSLIQWIVNRPFPNEPLYAGVLYRATVIRNPAHRHHVTWHDLPQKRYPWYPKGALYVLSGGTVKQMVAISPKVKQITVDDAYIGVLASYLGVRPIRLHGFIQWAFLPSLLEYFDMCTYMNIFGMADNLSPENIYFVHEKVVSYRNSSKWMCIHIRHPVLVTGGLVVLVVSMLYHLMKHSTQSKRFRQQALHSRLPWN